MKRFNPDAYGNPKPRKKPADVVNNQIRDQSKLADIARAVAGKENFRPNSEIDKQTLTSQTYVSSSSRCPQPKSGSLKRNFDVRKTIATTPGGTHLSKVVLRPAPPAKETIYEDCPSGNEPEPDPQTDSHTSFSVLEACASTTGSSPGAHQFTYHLGSMISPSDEEKKSRIEWVNPTSASHDEKVIDTPSTYDSRGAIQIKPIGQEQLGAAVSLTIHDKIQQARNERLRSIVLQNKAKDKKSTTSLADLDLARKKPVNKSLDLSAVPASTSSELKTEIHPVHPYHNVDVLDNISNKHISASALDKNSRGDGQGPGLDQGVVFVPSQVSEPGSLAISNSTMNDNIGSPGNLHPKKKNVNEAFYRINPATTAFNEEPNTRHPLANWDNTFSPAPDWEERPGFDPTVLGRRENMHQWSLSVSKTPRETTDALFRTIPVHKLRNYDEHPDGISMVHKITTVTGENAKHYGYGTYDIEDIVKYTRPLNQEDYEDWGKLDMRQPQNSSIKNETTEGLVMNWLDNTKERRAQAEEQLKRQLEAVRLLHDQSSPHVENPDLHAPKINIYLRPAQKIDIPGIAEIYNWYIENSPRPAEIDQLSVDEMEDRLLDVRSSKLPFIVAIQRHKGNITTDGNEAGAEAAGGSTQPIEKIDSRSKQVVAREKVVGFACAQDFTASDYVEHIAADLEIYVDPEYRQSGVGKCLIDKLLDCVDSGHQNRGGYLFGCPPELRNLYSNGGGRQLHKLLILIRKYKYAEPINSPKNERKYASLIEAERADDQENDFENWIQNYLAGWGFQVSGTLHGIGARKGRFIDLVYLAKETAWYPTEGAIPGPDDHFRQ